MLSVEEINKLQKENEELKEKNDENIKLIFRHRRKS